MSLVPALFVPHGGGPLPLLDDPGHASLTNFLSSAKPPILPRALLVISAHYEEPQVTIGTTAKLSWDLLFDYSGFPPETYSYTYPAPTDPSLVQELETILTQQGMPPRIETKRGLDHGAFVPLKLLFPHADIPIVVLSLIRGLDPAAHLALGAALKPLRHRGVMIFGSGMTFHNMRAFFDASHEAVEKNDAFHAALRDVLTSGNARRLVDWTRFPHARFAHPREEHLIPLLVVLGAAHEGEETHITFDDAVLGYRVLGVQVGEGGGVGVGEL